MVFFFIFLSTRDGKLIEWEWKIFSYILLVANLAMHEIVKFKGVVNGCCTILVNAIKIRINYSYFFRELEKAGCVLGVCQFRWGKSNHFAIGPKCPLILSNT